MGDIITTFAKIGMVYLKDEKKVKNKAYEYQSIKVYLLDIEKKTIEPSTNINKEDLIITRYGVGANSGNLFPNLPFEPKNVKNNFEKFIRGVLKANNNLLSCFTKEQIAGNNLLQILSSMDETFFDDSKEQLQSLEKYKEKGKVATYFALSYQDKPLSFYFKNIYEQYLNKRDISSLKGYDIISNEQGIGGDANLAFCSVNELPTKLKNTKYKLLPLSYTNAKKIKIGFDAMDKLFSHNFYGLKLAILPTLLNDDSKMYSKVLDILANTIKGNISEIEDSEVFINSFLEEVAQNEKNLPILNTILFYNKNNAAVDVLLQIDDVLPSYISHVSACMGNHKIKAFKNRDVKDNEEIIYMQNLFDDRLEIMNVLLSCKKVDKDILIEKFSQLIYWGNINKKYAYPVDWSKYFNGYYYNRSIEAIKRYIALFNDIKKIKEKFILQKECSLEEINKNEQVAEKQKKREKNIQELFKKSVFVQQNEILKTAYLLGMLSLALINWQKGVNQSNNSSYEKWLNGSGVITKDSLERIWKKCEETNRKVKSTARGTNNLVNFILEMVLSHMPLILVDKTHIKSAEVSLAFAMGGSDFNKIKEEK